MNYSYITLSNSNDLIEGVILRKLVIHRDESGWLFETLRTDWKEVYNNRDLPFEMQYMSVTPAGIVRDEDKWHIHKFQKDRFICVSGRIITAIYDPREHSATYGKLNLFLMGSQDDEMFMVVIPEETYHGFMVVSKGPAYLLNFPTQLYNAKDEGRIANTHLDWNKVRKDFSLI